MGRYSTYNNYEDPDEPNWLWKVAGVLAIAGLAWVAQTCGWFSH